MPYKLSKSFKFSGNHIFTQTSDANNFIFDVDKIDFNYFNIDQDTASDHIFSFQVMSGNTPEFYKEPPYFFDSKPETILSVSNILNYIFSNSNVHTILAKLNTDKLNNLFDYYLGLNQNDLAFTFGSYIDEEGEESYHELKQPYSLYNWEVCLHAPLQLVDHMLKSQQYDQALAMLHPIFDPMAKPDGDEEITKKCWRFPPFRVIDPQKVLERIFSELQAGKSNDKINRWRDNPYKPHLLARDRPTAYMKYVVMKYIEILIAYGDYYFRQNTMESIPLATQCYVIASHLYGPRGQKIPRSGKTEKNTYNTLLDKWDAFGNAMSDFELAFPNSCQTFLNNTDKDATLVNIFGSMNALYFSIPNNPNLTTLRDTIDDRLFKIRYSQDITGVFRQLPLFEPPIDPALLVQAAAQGLNLSSVLNDMNSPMPNYRFYYLLQKAFELCGELKALGNSFLSAKEKGNAEALSNLRAKHESSIYNLIMEVKKLQVEEANSSLEALYQSRKGPVSRMQYNINLVDQSLQSNIPTSDGDFSELPIQFENPVDESGLKLIKYEKEEMDKAKEAAELHIHIGALETLAGVFHALPNFSVQVTPWGVGTKIEWGMPNIAYSLQAVGSGMRIFADYLSYQSSSAARKAGFLRQVQERIHQANAAGYEIKNIDKQILTQKIRLAVTNQEITNQQKQIDNAIEVEEYLRNKYTNEELYSWMEGEILTLYRQAYNLAYELARKAEKGYCFERGLTSSNFIQYGYWDAGRDGLLAGEKLYLALKQLESAYQENQGYHYEITKNISLRRLNPIALLQLREIGNCEFSLPEVLFDMDYPGHYMRRIKSVALSIPCVVGPYTGLNCTLRLLQNEFRTKPIASNAADYQPNIDAPDERFNTVNVPITSIAVSHGQNDSGVFELNFRDERYIPFEGAGAISRWRLELPDFKQFDYNTITDVIIQLRYTSMEGGAQLKCAAYQLVTDYVKSTEQISSQDGLSTIFDIPHDFANEWYRMSQLANGPYTIKMDNLKDRLPYFDSTYTPKAVDLYLLTDLQNSGFSINNASFSLGGYTTEKLTTYCLKGNDITFDSWSLTITSSNDSNTKISKNDKLWLVVRYQLIPPDSI